MDWTTVVGLAGFLATLGYGVFLGMMSFGFRKWKLSQECSRVPPAVSIVIPARNEEEGIRHLLNDILSNDYPSLEVIVVDDASTDRTAQEVRAIADVRVSLLQLPQRQAAERGSKKRAVEAGVAAATGEWILQADADVQVGPEWVATMARMFDSETVFVAGPVLYHRKPGFFAGFQALEFLGFAGIAAGAIGLGSPILCSGANMAYRRSAFQAVGGHSHSRHLTSGDDELLLQEMHRQGLGQVAYCMDPHAVVKTQPMPTLSAFLNQRTRWASKGAHYPSRGVVALNAMIFTAFVFLIVGIPVAFAVPALVPYVLAGLAAKVLGEAALLGTVAAHFGRLALMRYLLPAQPLQLLYIVAASISGARGNFTWRGRRFDR